MLRSTLQGLLGNYLMGFQVACLRPISVARFNVSPHQLALLIIVDLLCELCFHYFSNLPAPEFNLYAVAVFGYYTFMLFAAAYAVAALLHRPQALLLFPIVILSLLPVIYVFWMPIFWFIYTQAEVSEPTQWALYTLYSFWFLGIVIRVNQMLQPATRKRMIAATFTFILAWYLPVQLFTDYRVFWHASHYDNEDDAYARYRALDAESIFYQQPDLLKATLAHLQPERPGIVDLYFLGFASYARQDVFTKETLYAQELFDKRFETQGRSVVLTNHLDHYKSTPLANSHNLAMTLKALGQRMNVEEDILILYMTSHGSKQHELSVDFWPLPLNDITPDMLKTYLDEAGIKWRVVMISACYSGGFLEPLSNPFSVVATAAAADRTSFGCGDHNDFTYFGEAVFKEQLSTNRSLIESLHAAGEAITRRERAEKLEPSNPQTFIGEAIVERLAIHERTLRQRTCNGRPSADKDLLC